MTKDLTTLVCLFHHQDQARAAVEDILGAGVQRPSISLIDKSGSPSPGFGSSSLEDLGVPERDRRHLNDGVRDGGVIVAVSAISDHVSAVETIFGRHRATKIDEAVTNERAPIAPVAAAAAMAAPRAEGSGERMIPVVEEELSVGKREVDHGGVRVYRRIVETPVEQTVNLREEHVVVDRHRVDRAANEQDLANQGDRTIELTETAEEAVVGKTARVVEEVRVGKETTEHAERIHDTVRKTEVEIEEIAPGRQGSSERDVTRGER